MYQYSIVAIGIGFCLDLVFGDPYFMPHPIRYIGNLISFLDKKLRPACKNNKKKERIAGILLVIFVTGITVLVTGSCIYLAYKIHPIAGFILETFWCYQLLAGKCLQTESKKVMDALEDGTLEEARYAVSMIVGRDTKELDKIGVTKATVETVAENTADGVVAPLLFMMLGGAVGGFFYKAVNTMDSMVGYKNEKYQYFGTAAAKLDDVCNYLPARICAIFMIFTAYICKLDGKNAYRIWKRDRRNHKSPNSAQMESVCAGALGIQLAGDASYFGTLHKKPYIGDATREIEPTDIKRSWILLYGAGVMTTILILIIGIVA
ncbi:MAG: adenosylcobinamide-phosphate synthase CbiB [Eubacteriales bacterium]